MHNWANSRTICRHWNDAFSRVIERVRRRCQARC